MAWALLFSTAGWVRAVFSRGRMHWVCLLLLPLGLLATAGARIELIGLAIGLLVLCLEVRRKGIAPWVAGIIAAAAAALFGFRIQFITNPAGGYVYLDSISIPLTVIWVLLILRSREALRRALPRPALQISIDLILVLNALLLALVSSQTRAEPIAFHLPLILLGIVPVTAIAAYRRERVDPFHQVIAFCLALYGISGVMKVPISLSLFAPLAVITLPIMTTSHALLAQGLAGAFPRPLPGWFAARGYTQGGFALLLLLLSSALAIGAVLAVHHSPVHGLFAMGIVPVVLVGHLLRSRVSVWLNGSGVEEVGGRCFLFGVGFHNLTLTSAVTRAEGMLALAGRSHTIVTPNTVALLRSRKNPRLLEVYRQADLVTADGVGIVWALRLFGVAFEGRVTGIDLAEALLKRASIMGYRVFLLGGKEGVAARAARRLEARIPGLVIGGTHHGHFIDDAAPLAAIERAHPQILLVGMGVPRQEEWMMTYAGRLDVPVMIGVGGALDVFAGDRRRASTRWQRLGLEWLYRLLHQPQRIKAAFAIPSFIGRVLCTRTAKGLATFIRLPAEEV